MTFDPLHFDPARIYAELITSGSDWADKESAASLLEETLRSVRSELKLGSDEKSDAARETVALADPAFREHVAMMVEARRVANIARVRYDATKVLAEARRTEQSTLRAQAQLAGMQT